jgi:hypothetical protein
VNLTQADDSIGERSRPYFPPHIYPFFRPSNIRPDCEVGVYEVKVGKLRSVPTESHPTFRRLHLKELSIDTTNWHSEFSFPDPASFIWLSSLFYFSLHAPFCASIGTDGGNPRPSPATSNPQPHCQTAFLSISRSAVLDRLITILEGRRSALLIVKPETVIKWHRQGFRLYWRWK